MNQIFGGANYKQGGKKRWPFVDVISAEVGKLKVIQKSDTANHL